MRYYIEHLPMTIPMGVQSENNAEAVELDVSDWLARDGSLSFSVWVTRPGETEAYQAANATLKDGILYWWPTSADTAIAGEGRVEILAVSANRRMLSGWTATSIRETTTETTTDAPVDQRPWLDQALLASDEAKAAAASAAASADQAEGVVKKEIAALTEDIARNTASPIIPTATGSIVTITDGAARPAVEVISHIEPFQAGSGVPSHSNVRPISGWNSVTAKRTGKNLLQNYDVTVTSSQAYAQTYRDYILPAGVYTLRAWVTQGGTVTTTSISVRSLNNISQILAETDLGSQQGEIVATFSAPDDGQGVRVYYYSNKTGAAMDTACTFANIVVESGRKYTGYEPYSGQTLSATLPETVYGGTLNWTTGVLKVTHHRIVFDGVTTGAKLDTTDPGNWTYAYIYPGSMPKTLKWNTTAYANKLKSVSTNTVIAFGLPADLTGVTSADDPGTVAAKYNAVLKQWYDAGTPLEIVYEFATPEEIQLSPQQLDTLKGINNVWSSTGDTTLSYVADTKMYIDQKLAAIAAATL